MDQANTLRQMLGNPALSIQPLFAGKGSLYLPIVARFILEQHAKLGLHAVLLDGTEQGLAAQLGLRERHDLWKVLRGQAHIQNIGVNVCPSRWVFRAQLCMHKLMHNPYKINALRENIKNLDALDPCCYVTLPCEAAWLGAQLAQGKECLWVVEPSVASVTEVFQGIRKIFSHAVDLNHALVVAGVQGTQQAEELYQALQMHISPWLGRDLRYVGFMPVNAGRMPLVDLQPLNQNHSVQVQPVVLQPAVLA